MKILITQGYTDRILNRSVKKDEILPDISESRANALVKAGVAEIISEDVTDYRKRISDLEAAIIEKDKAIEAKDAKIAELEAAAKKK